LETEKKLAGKFCRTTLAMEVARYSEKHRGRRCQFQNTQPTCSVRGPFSLSVLAGVFECQNHVCITWKRLPAPIVRASANTSGTMELGRAMAHYADVTLHASPAGRELHPETFRASRTVPAGHVPSHLSPLVRWGRRIAVIGTRLEGPRPGRNEAPALFPCQSISLTSPTTNT
jgi:hypothetical protein